MNIERHEFFPTSIYKFKHDFTHNELNLLVKHIEDNSLVEKNQQLEMKNVREGKGRRYYDNSGLGKRVKRNLFLEKATTQDLLGKQILLEKQIAKAEVSGDWSSFNKITGTQPQDELHKIDTFANLTKTITEVTKTILEEQKYMGEIEITNMWANILGTEGVTEVQRAHAPHSHSNNFLSGVFYLKTSSDTSPIEFFDPRPQTSVLRPRMKEYNRLNSNKGHFNSETGYGIVFPSWLMHWVPETKDERISISWNVIVRGEYGEPNTLQNAYI